ncbi:unnamed protein product [Diatraea saccharalis]|uniref:Uncharacterized protein n=1 Tax=Diatraea saccharalis TaxID=40085 RepID=A0A9N9QZ27_9NEOP|nr:unnamed protein product [Diatraea saccharalis]
MKKAITTSLFPLRCDKTPSILVLLASVSMKRQKQSEPSAGMRGIIVYDGRRDNAWRVTHASMYPDPDLGEYDIGGEKFTLMDGIVGLAHSPTQGLLYYQPLATDRVFSVSTAVLAAGPPAEGTDLPVNLVGRKSSQGLGIAVDPRDDTIIFSPLTETAIAAWNPITNSHK